MHGLEFYADAKRFVQCEIGSSRSIVEWSVVVDEDSCFPFMTLR